MNLVINYIHTSDKYDAISWTGQWKTMFNFNYRFFFHVMNVINCTTIYFESSDSVSIILREQIMICYPVFPWAIPMFFTLKIERKIINIKMLRFFNSSCTKVCVYQCIEYQSNKSTWRWFLNWIKSKSLLEDNFVMIY